MDLFHRRPLCIFGAALLLCGYILMQLPSPASLPVLLACAVLIPLIAVPRRIRSVCKAALPILCAAALAASVLIFRMELPARRILAEAKEQGTVIEFRIREVKSESTGICVADKVALEQDALLLTRLLVIGGEGLSVGDRVRALGVLRVLNEDESVYFGAEGCHAAIEIEQIYFADADPGSPLARLAALREGFTDRIGALAGEEGGGLLTALLLGETDRLTDRDALSFRRLGISHILAVSGMHLVTLSMALTAIFRRMRIPHSFAICLNVIFALCYTVLTGACPSVLRAFVMALVMQLAFFFGRKNDALSSLFFSGIALFLLDPYILCSTSFSLSFLSTLGIIVCPSVLRRISFLEKLPALLRRLLVTPIAVTLSATVFTMPISVAAFGQISLLSIPANLLFAFPFQVLLCMSAAAVAIGPVLPVRTVMGFLTHALLSAVRGLSAVPLAALDAGHPIIVAASALFLISAVVLLLLPRVRAKAARRTLLATGAVLAVSLAILALPRADKKGIVITTDSVSGEYFVLSSGIDRAVIGCADGGYDGLQSVKTELHRDAVTVLSLYAPTHYGKGTLSEVRALCRSYFIGRIVLPVPSDTEELRYCAQLVAYLDGEGIPYSFLRQDAVYEIAGYSFAVSGRYAGAGGTPSYLLSLLADGEKTVYFSGSAADGADADAFARVGAETVILGSGGISKPQRIGASFHGILQRLVLCSPLHEPTEASERIVILSGRYGISD